MAEFTAKMVMELREQTGAGMMDAKKALTEADGDMEKARDILRAKGQASAAKRAGRAAAEGIVAVADDADGTSLIELNSETDFVARNEDFKALAHQIAQVAAKHPGDDAGALMDEQAGDGQTIRQKLDAAVGKIGENLVFRRKVRFDKGHNTVIASYVHTVTNKIGVLVELHGDPNNAAHQELAKSIAMHVAASKPQYLKRDEVPADVVEREKTVLAEKTRNEGKPEAAIPKIVEGRVNKFYEDICLVDQPYVREPSKKVGQLASEAGAEIRRFALFQVGQE
jgi:elongation factor Ts